MTRLLALLFSLMSSAALAQTTGAVDPSAAPAQPSVDQGVPSGGCMPIGLTASGEIVFPIQCKELIDRHRGAAVAQKPAVVEEKPAAVEEKPAAVDVKPVGDEKPAAVEEKRAATEEKAAAKQSEDPTESSQPTSMPVETVPSPIPSPRRLEPRERAVSSGDCTRYRSYDRASGTYRGYNGQVRPCRVSSR